MQPLKKRSAAQGPATRSGNMRLCRGGDIGDRSGAAELGSPACARASKMVKSSFSPSSDQWANIALGTVTDRKFPGLVSVDATVATDDDLATQVFSPFTGQIRDIAVRAGDHVEKGAVLMTVAATEAVQSQSDLIAAADAWNAARVTAHNADEGEKRQQALYQERKCGSQGLATITGRPGNSAGGAANRRSCIDRGPGQAADPGI